jgi:integrase
LNLKSGKKMARSQATEIHIAYPKSDVRYWRPRIYKPVAGNGTASPFFAARFQYAGKRMGLSLNTANAEEAATRARDHYRDLLAGGWDQLLAKLRPQSESKSAAAASKLGKQTDLTVGQFIELVRARNLVGPATLKGYVMRFRQIVAEIKGITQGRGRFGYKGKGYRSWIAKIDAVPLASLSADDVRAWKRAVINAAGANVLNRKAATISVNSTLRQARSLFGERKVLPHVPELARPHLFEGVEFEPRQDTKFYGVGIDASALLRLAIQELQTEELKAFLLAIAIGLRRKEADNLMWTSFDFGAGTLRVQPTEHYALKTNESAAILKVDPEIMSLFRGWFVQARSRYVLESEAPPRAVDYFYYRANETFAKVVVWLRTKSIKANKPFHTLRKMFGSLIAEAHGIHAASSALRHTNIELTASFYADRTVKVTSGLGSVLSGVSVTDLSPQVAARTSKARRRTKRS